MADICTIKRSISALKALRAEARDRSSVEVAADVVMHAKNPGERLSRTPHRAGKLYAQTTGARPFATPRRRQLGQRYSKIRQFREIETREWPSFAIRIVCYRIRFLGHLDRDGDVFSSAAFGVPSPVTKRLVESSRLLNCSPTGRNIAVAWADPNDDRSIALSTPAHTTPAGVRTVNNPRSVGS